MKKFISVIIATLTLTGFALGLAACGNDGGDNDKPVNVVTLSSFSEFAELRSFNYAWPFGKAEVNKDKAYVSDGETSGKFTVEKGSGETNIAIFCDTKWNAKKDFGDVKALTVDAFNPSDEVRKISISFTTRKSGNARAEYSKKTFDLSPGKNSLVYEIERAVAKQVTYVDKVETINFYLDRLQENYSVYLDNLQAHLTSEPVQALTKTYKTSEEGDELLFFDDMQDRFFVKPNTIRAVSAEAPEISICRNPAYIRSGNGSLQIDTAVYPEGNAYQYPGFTISGEAVSRVNFSEYTKMIFYVMVDTDLEGKNLSVEFYDVNDLNLNTIDHVRNYYDWGKIIPANTWIKLECPISALVEKGLDVEHIDRINIYCDYSRQADFKFTWYLDDFTLVK